MSASAPAIVRPQDRLTRTTPMQLVEPDAYDPGPVPRRARRWFPAATMLVGALTLVGSASLVLRDVSRHDGVRSMPMVARPAAPGPLAVTVSGPGDVTVLTQTYEPGKDSGWHSHPGIHAVAVLSGTLTIVDEGCQVQTFGPGQSYVGGQLPHLVVNDTADPVEMVVTYLNPAGPHDSNRRTGPPTGCARG